LLHPAAALRTPSMKETLRADFATITGLLAGPAPTLAPTAEEVSAAERSAAEEPPPPDPPPADQLGFFG
jgi:hypothetical protein